MDDNNNEHVSNEQVKKAKRKEYNLNFQLKKKQKNSSQQNIYVKEEFKCANCIERERDEAYNCVELEVVNFLSGRPLSFYNINKRIPIPMSKKVISCFGGVCDIPDLQMFQAEERLIHLELEKMGIFYSKLPNLIGTRYSRETMPGVEWSTYREAYKVIQRKFDCSVSIEKHYEIMDLIIKNNMEFLIMLHEEFGLTHENYMNCVLSSFASDELYIPFNTPEEIIRCAQGKKA